MLKVAGLREYAQNMFKEFVIFPTKPVLMIADEVKTGVGRIGKLWGL